MREDARNDRRLIVAALAGLVGGALLVRRSTVWLAIGAALGLLAGRRLREPGERDRRETEPRR